ncbi:MAG: HD domain-containing protein [Deltaproteobacteria bacterium]|nr:HD domain-containing protein [Deltaproteobacteria bacterium]
MLHRKALRKELPALLARDLDQRIDAYGIKGDRADVIGVAAVVFDTLAERLGIASFHVPDVDLRDGILVDLARQQFHAKPRVGVRGRAKALLAAAREFGARYGYDNQHAEHVRRLAKSLFDQLKPLHHLGTEMRLALELGALLHDVGQSVNYRDHHRHGAYLVENGRLPGLSPSLRHIVSCLVRYHGKEKPGRKETELEMFDDDKREQVRMLIALLRVADGLDARHQQQVAGILVRVNDQRATIGLKPAELPESVAWSAARKAKLLEKVFSLKIDWDRSPA